MTKEALGETYVLCLGLKERNILIAALEDVAEGYAAEQMSTDLEDRISCIFEISEKLRGYDD